jgi:hypothetical protein
MPMPIDIAAAERFVLANARLLDRHRLAVLLHAAPVAPVLDALRAYRNPDGGFGHALEPDIRDPESQPACTVHALDVLAAVGALDDPMVAGAAAWAAQVAEPDGGLPFVLDTPSGGPRAPFLANASSSGGSFLTFALAGPLWEAGLDDPWLERATGWCWERLDSDERIEAYGVRAALVFLDAVPDAERARAAIERLRPNLEPDGSIRVRGGIEDERLTPLKLSGRPGARSRALFTDEQIEADLDRLERDQRDDGGWDFDWLAWSQGQAVDCRGEVTVGALATLRAHGRV